jgi:cytochrome P450
MEYNPLAPEVIENPYPYYCATRLLLPGLEPLQCWAVSRYADVDYALRNPAAKYSS